jgi:phospho-N-acetylmuramoyl-pentapeptide-transferase
MILWLIAFLEERGFHIPAAFSYTSTRMMLAAVTSLVICIGIGPFFIRKLYELKIGQRIRKEECPLLGQLHEKKQNTPTMGGILILSSMLLSLLLWMQWNSIFTWLLLFTTLSLGCLGGMDDYLKLKYKNTKGLTARKKLLFQCLVASSVASYLLIPSASHSISEFVGLSAPFVKVESRELDQKESVSHMLILNLQEFASRLYIPFFKDPVLTMKGASVFAMFAFILFIIVGTSNAVNLTDGLDGLAAGCLIITASSLAVVAFVSNNLDIARYLHIPYIEGSGEIAVYMAAVAGACLGFLWYNSHPAQVFMGDIGSLSLGAVIGVSAVLLKREILLGVVGGIFVAETISVILQVGSFKLRNKKRIFLCTPLHHHFEYQGWAETKVVTRFWIVALLLAIVGIASLKFQ